MRPPRDRLPVGHVCRPDRHGETKGSRPARAGRLVRLRDRARSRPWAVLVISSVFPLTAAIVIGVAYARGHISFKAGSARVVPSLVALAVLLGALVFLSWVAAPVLGSWLGRVHGFIHRQSTAIARGGWGAFLVRFPPLVAGMVAYAFLVLNSALLGLLLVGNFIAILVGLAVFAREVMRVGG